MISAVAALLATAAALVTGALVGQPAVVLGVLLTGATAVYALPALVAGLRSVTTAGLSMVALAINSVEGALYLAAGLGFGGIAPAGMPVLAYALFGALALVSNLPRLVRVSLRRARRLDPIAPLCPIQIEAGF